MNELAGFQHQTFRRADDSDYLQCRAVARAVTEHQRQLAGLDAECASHSRRLDRELDVRAEHDVVYQLDLLALAERTSMQHRPGIGFKYRPYADFRWHV